MGIDMNSNASEAAERVFCLPADVLWNMSISDTRVGNAFFVA